MFKLEQLKRKVQKEGTEKMKDIIVVVENYVKVLNQIFNIADVKDYDFKLDEFDFSLFLHELQTKGEYQNKDLDSSYLAKNVFYVVRHTWELIDRFGYIKSGDDLHKEWPEMFKGDNMLSIDIIFNEMHSF